MYFFSGSAVRARKSLHPVQTMMFCKPPASSSAIWRAIFWACASCSGVYLLLMVVLVLFWEIGKPLLFHVLRQVVDNGGNGLHIEVVRDSVPFQAANAIRQGYHDCHVGSVVGFLASECDGDIASVERIRLVYDHPAILGLFALAPQFVLQGFCIYQGSRPCCFN